MAISADLVHARSRGEVVLRSQLTFVKPPRVDAQRLRFTAAMR